MSRHGYSPPCKMDTNGVPHEGEVTIDLLIETLTGTAFEMTVSPLDTVAAIKSKIHRIEGIPVSAQHLLFNLNELQDNARLLDCSIKNGAKLKLVTSMRGGPISNRRFMPSSEERSWMDLVDANRCDNILEHLPSGQLTVLVFCEGEQLNLFRVVENVDGTYSPITDSVSSSSVRNVLSSDEPEAAAQRLLENTVTMGKVQDLQQRLRKGMRRRKHEASNITCESPNVESTPEAVQGTSRNHAYKLSPQLASQSTSKLTSASNPSLPHIPPKPSVKLSVSSYMPGSSINPGDLLPCTREKHASLPALEVSACSSSSSFFSPASKSFLPAMSLSRGVRKDPVQPHLTFLSQRRSQIPSLNPVPRSMAPSLPAPPLPRRPPPLRPIWSQRQRPPALHDIQHHSAPLQNKLFVPPPLSSSGRLTMCQTQRKLGPILPNHRTRSTHPTVISSPHSRHYLSCGINNEAHNTADDCDESNDARLHVLNTKVTSFLENRGQLDCQNSLQRKLIWTQPSLRVFQINQFSSSTDCGLVMLHRPSTCPKERFISHLSSSLNRNFSLRFPCVLPEQLPLVLSYRLTERLFHHLPITVSEFSLNHLSAQLCDRICDCIEGCLSNKVPKDILGRAVSALFQTSRFQGTQLRNRLECSPQTEMLLSQTSVTKHRETSINQNNQDVLSDVVEVDNLGYLDVQKANGKEETPRLLSRAPRFHSAPSFLSSQTHSLYHSAITGMHPEPVSLRLTDSSLYQRRSLSSISGSTPRSGSPATSSLAPSVFLNSIHAGPHSMECVQRVIESTVQHVEQSNVQQRLQGDQRQIQIVNRADRVSAPLAVFPQYDERKQRILFGPNLQSSGLSVIEEKTQSRNEDGEVGALSARAPGDLSKVLKSSHLASTPSKSTVPCLTEEICGSSAIDENKEQPFGEVSKVPKKPHRRCCQCRKKLTISNKYLCRCQKLFCSMHRYSESHDCSYNYKEEGRKLLQEENPQVMAEKIVKM